MVLIRFVVVVVASSSSAILSYHRRIGLIVSFASSFNAARFRFHEQFWLCKSQTREVNFLNFGINLYKFGDRLATFLRNDLKMLSHFDMRVLIFDINQSHFIRIGIFVSADLRLTLTKSRW